MNTFFSSREIHETCVEFIHNSVQFIPEVIVYTGHVTDTQEMDFIQLYDLQSLFWGDGTWFVVPSQFYLKPVTIHPQLGESCAVLCHLNLGEVTLQLESGLEQSVSS